MFTYKQNDFSYYFKDKLFAHGCLTYPRSTFVSLSTINSVFIPEMQNFILFAFFREDKFILHVGDSALYCFYMNRHLLVVCNIPLNMA